MIFWQGKIGSKGCHPRAFSSKAGHPIMARKWGRWPEATKDLDRHRLISNHVLLNTIEIGFFFDYGTHCGLSTGPLKTSMRVTILWSGQPDQPKSPHTLNRYPILYIGLFQLPLCNCAPNLVMSIISGLTMGMG